MTDNENAEQASTVDNESAAPAELPEDVVSEAERLTRLARSIETEDTKPATNTASVASEEATVYRDKRDAMVAEHGYTARLRADDDTLVLYPDEWLDGDTVVVSRIADTDRAIEVSLATTVGEETFESIEQHNAAIIEQVEAEHGEDHAANLRAFADFMGNHYLRRIDEATADHISEFREEYYRRNVWPTEAQRTALDESLELLSRVGTPT